MKRCPRPLRVKLTQKGFCQFGELLGTLFFWNVIISISRKRCFISPHPFLTRKKRVECTFRKTTIKHTTTNVHQNKQIKNNQSNISTTYHNTSTNTTTFTKKFFFLLQTFQQTNKNDRQIECLGAGGEGLGYPLLGHACGHPLARGPAPQGQETGAGGHGWRPAAGPRNLGLV